MKKIILAALTVLMMFGLIGCSGVLHDTPVPVNEPVTIANASWFALDINVWGDNTDKAQIIISGDDVQSGDTKLPAYKASEGAVFYYTMDKANKELKVSYQEDEPEYTAKPGVVRIYVYTNISAPKAWYWDGDFDAPTKWPGNELEVAGDVPVPFVLEGLVATTGGEPTLAGALMTYTKDIKGNVTYKVQFKATATEHTFAITDVEGKLKYTSDKVIELTKTVDLKAAGKNDTATKFTGLKAESLYDLTITTTPAGKVSVVVEEAPIKVTGAKITVSGLPAGLNGKTLYFTGNFNEWKTPGHKETLKVVVKDGSVSVTLPEFEYKPADGGYEFEGKFACGDGDKTWSKPEICVENNEGKGGNIKFTLTETKKSLVGTYDKVIDDGLVYLCKWEVK